MKPIFLRLLTSAAVALALGCAPTQARAAEPPANLPLGAMPAACASQDSAECERWTIARLDIARTTEGLEGYSLPADFLSLSADRQLLILADLDRVAYGLTPIYGLNASLGEAALAGVREARDPLPPTNEGPWQGFGSDWASAGALVSYYLWMYDDGWEGPNIECTSPTAADCWGHRRVILGEAFPLPQPELLGVASGESNQGDTGTALILSSSATASSYLTWTQALGGESCPTSTLGCSTPSAETSAPGVTTSAQSPPPSGVDLTPTLSPSARASTLPIAEDGFSPAGHPMIDARGNLVLAFTVNDPGRFTWALSFEHVDLASSDAGRQPRAPRRPACTVARGHHASHCHPLRLGSTRGNDRDGGGSTELLIHPGPQAARALASGQVVLMRGTFTFRSAFGGPPVSRRFDVTLHRSVRAR